MFFRSVHLIRNEFFVTVTWGMETTCQLSTELGFSHRVIYYESVEIKWSWIPFIIMFIKYSKIKVSIYSQNGATLRFNINNNGFRAGEMTQLVKALTWDWHTEPTRWGRELTSVSCSMTSVHMHCLYTHTCRANNWNNWKQCCKEWQQ